MNQLSRQLTDRFDKTFGGNQIAQWRPLYLLNTYRLILALLFVTAYVTNLGPLLLGVHAPWLFLQVSIVYLVMTIAAMAATYLRQPGFEPQVYLQIFVDIPAIIFLMHASGGITSGIGMLLIPSIAGASLLMVGRMAILFAALASLAILSHQVFAQLTGAFATTHYTQAGILGATLFATAIVGHYLARRVKESEQLAEQRGIDLANMEELNEYIIQRMQSGIIVVDSQQRVRLINQSALHMLGKPQVGDLEFLIGISNDLCQQLAQWQEYPYTEPKFFTAGETENELLPRFAKVGFGEHHGTTIFLEDTSALSQQVQEAKLASLGRLTASIAHEIRNPLGAISHAGQLLDESENIAASEKRLIQIIRDHSLRVNSIIENVLQISRRNQAYPETINLMDWVESFLAEFCDRQGIDAKTIRATIKPSDTMIRVDKSQLHQVMWNLCQNAVQHASPAKIFLEGGKIDEFSPPVLNIIDKGASIPDEIADKLFEPFFTTKQRGTGLGLYLAQELCLCNQAQLKYFAHEGGGNCFRITFDDPTRQSLRV